MSVVNGATDQQKQYPRQGPPPPVPQVDSIDCWMPPAEQTPVEPREFLLADVRSLLSQLQVELGHHIDDRLAAHHEDMLQRFTEESKRRAEDMLTRFTQQTLVSPLAGEKAEAMFRRLADEAVAAAAAADDARCEEFGHCSLPGSSTLSGLNHAEPGDDVSERVSEPKSQLQQRRFSAGSDAEAEKLTFEFTESVKRRRIRLLPKPRLVSYIAEDLKNHLNIRSKVRYCFETRACETFVSVLILTNVCFLGLEVQSVRGVQEERIPFGFKAAEYAYTLFFLLEFLLRLLAYGFHDFFVGPNQGWNLIDFVLVFTSVLEKVMYLILDVSSNLEYLRIIRIARTVRVLRVVRIVTFFRPLRILVYSVMDTVRNLGWTLVLLAIIVYLFAVTFTLAASQSRTSSSTPKELQRELDQNFGSLWSAMFVLFKSITGGIDWTLAADPLEALDPVWSYLFLAYIAFCNLAVLNVVTGVVCQTALESASKDQVVVQEAQMALRRHYQQQLQELFKHFDTDESKFITLQEFEEQIQSEELKHYFDILELSIDDAWSLFKLLDTQDVGQISFDVFVSGCLKLRGSARSIDMHMLMYQVKWVMDRMAYLVAATEAVQRQVEVLQMGTGHHHVLRRKNRVPTRERIDSIGGDSGPSLPDVAPGGPAPTCSQNLPDVRAHGKGGKGSKNGKGADERLTGLAGFPTPPWQQQKGERRCGEPGSNV